MIGEMKERKKDPKGWLFGAQASSELGVRPRRAGGDAYNEEVRDRQM